MDKNCQTFIENELKSCVTRTIERLDAEDTYRPFHRALLSETALFWSRFERSFSTSFGQRVIEKISKSAAIAGGASNAENQVETTIKLYESQLNSIENHIVNLRNTNSGVTPDWDSEIHNLSSIPSEGNLIELRVISDLWWKKDGVDHYLSIKTVKPNIDQTAEAKRDLLKLKLANPNAKVFFGLYYNPYGEDRTKYSWSPPKNIFNFNTDSCVLIGKDYWDTLGGNGFYEELIMLSEKVGIDTRSEIELLR